MASFGVPFDVEEGEYDATIVYHTNDRQGAFAFKELLHRIVQRKRVEEDFPNIGMMEDFVLSAAKFKKVDFMVENSTFVFIYITDDFSCDDFCKIMVDELIISVAEDYKNRWKLIPVMFQKTQQRVPLGLKSLNTVSLSRLNYLGDVSISLRSLNLNNIHHYDRFFASNIQKLFAKGRYLRLKGDKDENEDWGE